MQLHGLRVIVTGGAHGMGAHFVRRLCEAGARVAVGDRDELAPAELPAGATARVLDVADEADCEGFVAWASESLGGVDALVNNAGILRDALLVGRGRDGKLRKLPRGDWEAVIAVNLAGATWMAREVAAALMAAGRPGVIVNMSSISRHGNRGQSSYGAAKAALAANTVTWGRELAPYGIRVVGIAPGMIDTPMTQGLPSETLARLVDRIPLGRIGTPEDVWQAVAFALRCDYLTAETIDVAGGLTM
jgi:3-oxoacyl-[acyl-carrier protein] reductase